MNNETESQIEIVRQEFMPEKVSILFIGESAPISGKFFYTEDSLCAYTQTAFAEVFPEVKTMSRNEFLNFFKSKGCFSR